MESVILSKEHLLVLGDFNIHIDVSDDADAVKFLVCAQTVPSPPWWNDNSLRPIVTNAVQ